MNTEESPLCWYAVSTMYCRELKLKKLFEKCGIEAFVPLHYETVVKHEAREYIKTPAIHNLVFVHTALAEIEAKIAQIDIDFKFIKDPTTGIPAVIPQREMDTFIRVTQISSEEQILYLRDNFEHFKTYTPVRVTGGRFEGVEGYLVRIRRDRKVVMLLGKIAAVALSGIDPSLIEVIG